MPTTVESSGGDQRDDDAVPRGFEQLRIAKDGARTSASEKPSHTVKRDELKLNDRQHEQRQVQKREERHRVHRQPALHPDASAFAPQKRPHQQAVTSAISSDGDGRAEGPVARGGELVLHQVADQDGACRRPAGRASGRRPGTG